MKRFPHLVDGAVWQEEANGSFLLSLPDGSDALRMGRLEHAIIVALDGSTPPSEIARNLSRALGRSIGEAGMNEVLRRLAGQGFVVWPPRPKLEVLPGVRVRCCGCGHCCRLWVGPLAALEQRRLAALPWETRGEQPPDGELFFEQEGQIFLRQKPGDTACLFLDPDGCRIHRVFGFEAKPSICRMFPLFTVEIDNDRLRAGVCYECPGLALAGPTDDLVSEMARAGELLLATRREAKAPTPLGEEGPQDPTTREAGLELEQELLALLDGWGGSVSEALAEGGRRLLDIVPPMAAAGCPASEWLAELGQMLRQQQESTSAAHLENQGALDRLRARLEHLGPPPRLGPCPPTLDRLLRQAWSNYVFTRYHVFRFGQLSGLALLILLQLLVLQALGEDAATEPSPLQGALVLSRTLDLLRVLAAVSTFPGVGRRTLSELIAQLEDGAGR
jgi:Fe-S-cluster containining protein